MKIVGRKEEKRELDRICSSKRPEFVAVYGRRRVGKTYLIREYFGRNFAFYTTGVAGGNTSSQLRAFYESLKIYGTCDSHPTDWSDAFGMLVRLLEDEHVVHDSASGKRVVFIDELPWLDTPRSDFKSALEYFWNSWGSAQPDLLLIVCGSATTWIIENLFKEHGGLHNRVTQRMFIEPFSLEECEAYFDYSDIVMSRRQMIESYMVFGGVPYYLDLMDKRLSLYQNVDKLCFARNAPLRDEFAQLYASLFKKAQNHIDVVRALATREGGLTRKVLAQRSNLQTGGSLSRVLEELEQCGFVRKYRDFTKGSREMTYQLIDPFTLFYLSFCSGENDEAFWTYSVGGGLYHAWSGHAFELVCLTHLRQIKRALGISGMAVEACSWTSRCSSPGAQIDLLIDRPDDVINVCEMKFSHDEYAIDKAYEASLLNKMAAFARESGTKKALHLTLVSAGGLRRNEHSGIVQTLLLADDLFG